MLLRCYAESLTAHPTKLNLFHEARKQEQETSCCLDSLTRNNFVFYEHYINFVFSLEVYLDLRLV